MLGPTELLNNGEAVPTGHPKQRVLLTALAMHADRVVSVDALTEFVWPEGPPRSAPGSLQVYVSNLRRVLERDGGRGRPRRLVRAAQGYGLMTGGLELDVRELERHVQAGRDQVAGDRLNDALAEYDAGLGLWRGDTYADVRSAEWALPEIGRVEELRLTATDERAALLLRLRRAPEVVATLEGVVAQHPLREGSWELLALGYAQSARQGDALEALRRARVVLADELGIDPGPRLRRLEEAVLRQDPDTLKPGSTSQIVDPFAAHPAASSFVGRARELEVLQRAVAEVRRGMSRVVLVNGEAGGGKTRLLQELAASISFPFAWGRSPDHEAVPALWPWGQSLAAVAVHRPDVPLPVEVSALVAGSAAAEPTFAAEGARLRAFARVADYLAAAAPLAVLLEDLHSADAASLRLLEHLAAATIPGLLVVGSYRRHEAVHLTAVLSRLARAGAKRIELDGFSIDEVRALMAAITGADPGFDRASQLCARTAGNPFFVVEMADSADAVPSTVGDVVRHRIEELGEPVAEILDSAAVIGDAVQAWLLAEVAGHPLENIVSALEAAYTGGLLVKGEPPSTLRFTHSLVVDALLEHRSTPWRAVRHHRCATALTRVMGDREELHPTIARHWLAAAELGPGPAAAAAEFCGRAARSAARRLAHEDAVTLWQEAIAADSLAGSPATARFELALGLARAHYAAGHYHEGFVAVEMALAAAGNDPADVVTALDTAVAHGSWLPFAFGTMPPSLPGTLDAAMNRLPEGTAGWAHGLALRAVLAGTDGREYQIDATVTRAVGAALNVGDPDLTRRVLHLQLIAFRGCDFIAQRAAAALAILALPNLTEPLAIIADLDLVSHDVETGHVDRALRRIPELQTRAHSLRDPTLVRQVASTDTGLAIFTGRHAEALGRLDRLQDASNSVDAAYFQATDFGQRAQIAFETGRLDQFSPILESVYTATGQPAFAYGVGLARLATGNLAAARDLLVSTPMPPRDYAWVSSAVLRLELARGVDDLAAVRECRSLLEPFAGGLAVTGTSQIVAGAYDGHLGEASLALGEVDRARRELTSAVALLERNGAAYWLARARQALANCR